MQNGENVKTDRAEMDTGGKNGETVKRDKMAK